MTKLLPDILRIGFGLMLVVFSLMGFFRWQPPEVPPTALQLRTALLEAGYFFPTVFIVYLIVGIAYLANRFVPLATVVLFPVTLNIFFYHLFLIPGSLAVTLLLLVPNLLMMYFCRDSYHPLLKPRSG